MRHKFAAHVGKIDGTLTLVNLNRVASAEGNLRTGLTIQMIKDLANANLTIVAGAIGDNFGAFVAPQVPGE